MKKFAIIGLGGIGGYCAVRLQKAGFAVHCLARSNYEAVKQQGLTLKVENETIKTTPHVYNNPKAMPACDVILITTKTTSNQDLPKQILPNMMHDNTLVVTLQNGIGMADLLAEFINPKNIIGGSCLIKVERIAPSILQHYALNIVEFGPYIQISDRSSQQLHALENDFTKAKFNCQINPSLASVRWKKLAINIPLNGLAVILNASNNDLVANKASFRLVCKLCAEVINAAVKCGAELPKGFYQMNLEVFLSLKSTKTSYQSMKIDYDNKRPLEIDSIYLAAIEAAKKHGVSMPLTEVICDQLLFLDRANRRDS